MISLEEFVRESLAEIVRGSVAAAEAISTYPGATVNPRPFGAIPAGVGAYQVQGLAIASPVEFDVAVAASEEVGSQIKVGVLAGVFGVGGAGNESEQSSRVTRLKFRVYLTLPMHAPKAASD